jgi:hypothetical protein
MVRFARIVATPTPPGGSDLAAENARLRRENEHLRMEMKFRLIEDRETLAECAPSKVRAVRRADELALLLLEP